jgi:hypothetical protein
VSKAETLVSPPGALPADTHVNTTKYKKIFVNNIFKNKTEK